jgi:hypothetical protein
MSTVFAQVEHNFEMDPENTDCHLLNPEYKTVAEFIQQIRQRSFRFNQKIRISRYRTPHQLEYFSCDGEKGYILALMENSRELIYSEIPKSEWDALLNARDILEYYNLEFTRKYEPLE